jgi:hypothetical protein
MSSLSVDSASVPFTKEVAYSSLAEACSVVGLDPDSAELIRMGSAAVYWLDGRRVVARVTRSLDQLPLAQREVAISRWLKRSGVAAIEVLDVPQPIVAEGHVVTFWESVSDREEYGSAGELGSLLRVLHHLPPPTDLDLPPFTPFDRTQERLARVDGLEDDRAFLIARAEHLAERYDELVFALDAGIIHADANVGNLLRTRDGAAVLADLDGFATGAREWDLLQTAMFYDRFGWHTESEYRDFVSAYGFDILSWDGYETLADIRELLMVTWLLQNAGSDPASRKEFAKRIKALRTGGSRKGWSPL